jgi:hypothetical protein
LYVFIVLLINLFARACGAVASDFSLLVQRKVTKRKDTRAGESCVVKTFLPCPILIRHPGSAKSGATSMSRALMEIKKAFPPLTSTWGNKPLTSPKAEIDNMPHRTCWMLKPLALAVRDFWLNASGARRGEAGMPSL